MSLLDSYELVETQFQVTTQKHGKTCDLIVFTSDKFNSRRIYFIKLVDFTKFIGFLQVMQVMYGS